MDINVNLRIDAPKGGLRRAALFVGLPLAFLGITAVVAHATLSPDPATWAVSGKPVPASSLLADLQQLDTKSVTVTAWSSYPCSLTTLDGAAVTGGQVNAFYRRVGDTLEFEVSVGFTSTAQSSSSQGWQLSLPTGLSYDRSKGSIILGYGDAYNGTVYALMLTADGPGGLYINLPGSGGAMNTTNPGFVAGFGFQVRGSAPIVGWTVNN